MPFWRRKPRLRVIHEAEAYDRSYGDVSSEVRIVKLPPRRPRDREVLASGELLRRAFLDRLEARDAEAGEPGSYEPRGPF
jgi:hypothetical protein